jgi:hypothetical protein
MVATTSPPERAITRIRADGRRQLLVYVDPEVIKNAKKAAVDLDTTASGVVEVAIREWLDRRSSNKPKKR